MAPICKICSKPTETIHDEQYGHNYYFCPDCEFIFLDESKIITPDQEKKEYGFHQNSFDNAGYVQMLRDFIEQSVLPFKACLKTALDFGSGPGPVLAELLRQEGLRTEIYDKHFAPDKTALNKKYDLITATEVLEHLKDPLTTLKHLKSLLNPKGIIAVMTLFHPNNEAEFKKWWYRRDSTHIAFYTPKTFAQLAQLAGLIILLVDKKNICVLSLSDEINPA
ncbi:MAG: class I SAM-dependent methyltransferase [bacterium]